MLIRVGVSGFIFACRLAKMEEERIALLIALIHTAPSLVLGSWLLLLLLHCVMQLAEGPPANNNPTNPACKQPVRAAFVSVSRRTFPEIIN